MALTTYWREIAIFLLIVVVIIQLKWPLMGMKGKKANSMDISKMPVNPNNVKIVTSIRKQLRQNHKQNTALLKDLDGFLNELPAYIERVKAK